jgi:hypothetical protein
MKRATVSIRLRVYEVLRDMKRAQRERVLRWVEQLEIDPSRDGEFTEVDDTARKIQVSIIGSHAIYFWYDGPVNEVKVVDLRPADRGA